MSRRHAYVSPPSCPHYEQRTRDHADLKIAWQQRRTAAHDWPGPAEDPEPTPPGLYCDECRAALYQPGAEWPREVWDYLNMIADRDAGRAGSIARLKGAPKLPPTPKPRSISPAKWLQLAIDAFQPDDDPKAASVVGRAIKAEIPYRITSTNGYCLVAEPGEGAERVYAGLSVTRSGPWIDLPADLQLALKRVRIFANDRIGAVKITIDRDFARIILHASSDDGEATEYLDNGAINQSADFPEGMETCLSAEYLDRVCDCWPVRWYVRPAQLQESTPTKFNPNPKPYLYESPQLFCPSGTDARVLIMPMKDLTWRRETRSILTTSTHTRSS